MFSARSIITAAATLALLAAPVATATAASAGANGTVTAVTHSAQHYDTTNTAGPATKDSPNGPVWAYDNLAEKFTVVPLSDQLSGANYRVTIDVTGSFKGFADPNTGLALDSAGSVKGTITYDVLSVNAPDPAKLLPNQEPKTGLGAAMSQLFDGSCSIVGGGDYTFSYQNGNYVQDTNGIHGAIVGH